MKDSDIGKVYSSGEVICREGDKGDVMYSIQSGKVKITKKSPSGDILIATLKKGDIFGEMALFDRMPRAASAVASGDTRILSIDRRKLFASIEKDPTLVFKIIESMSKRIRRLNKEFTRIRESKLDIIKFHKDIDEICELVLEEASNIITSDNGSIMLLDDEGKSLEIKAAFGNEADQKIKLSVGQGIAGDVMKTGKAELINNASMDSRFIHGKININSMLCVPLRDKNNIFGVINLSNSSQKMFTLEDLKLFNALALNTIIAIQNAMNFTKLKSAADEAIKHATILNMC
jgi:signal-transduction protein with cAMP-binding, CBS, and nucleotidyltransferase domain